jgi:hypothetical protein
MFLLVDTERFFQVTYLLLNNVEAIACATKDSYHRHWSELPMGDASIGW